MLKKAKGKALLLMLLIIVSVGFVFSNFIKSLFYISLSYISAPDLEYVEGKTWSYVSGFKLGEGDFLQFGKPIGFELKHDTIYYQYEPCAVVLRK